MVKNDDDAYRYTQQDDDVPTGDYHDVLIPLIIATVSLWIQCVVTEERFLPSLAAMCDSLNIPPSVAASTIMSMGSASPNLFAVLISVFITQSDLGVGTIVGSEMFQQLFVVAGVIFSSRSNAVVLAPETIIREVFFYGLSLGIMYFSLSASVVPDSNGIERSQVSLPGTLLMLGMYGLYVLVCIHFERILGWIGRKEECGGKSTTDTTCGGDGEGGGDRTEGEEKDVCETPPPEDLQEQERGTPGDPAAIATISSILDHSERFNMELASSVSVRQQQGTPGQFIVETSEPLIMQVAHEPSANFDHGHRMEGIDLDDRPGCRLIGCSPMRGDTSDPECAYEVYNDGDEANEDEDDDISVDSRSHFEAMRHDQLKQSQSKKDRKEMKRLLKIGKRAIIGKKQDKRHALNEILIAETKDGESTLSCTLWQLPLHYHSQAPLLGITEWQRRWFTFASDGTISSFLEDGIHGRGQLVYPIIGNVEVDRRHLVIRLHSDIRGGPTFVLMAPTEHILDIVLEKLHRTAPLNLQGADHSKSVEDIEEEVVNAECKARQRLIDFPTGSSFLGVLVHLVLLPFKFLLHHTIPDVRYDVDEHSVHARYRSYVAMIMSAVWIITASFFMCKYLEEIGNLLRIPSAIMGSTVSAVGTSIPVFLASNVASQQGLGNVAISNAISSNSFNILIGLGLPWTLYIIFVSNDGYYSMLEAEGLQECVFTLIISLAIMCALVIFSRFTLPKWHAPIYFIMYILYILSIILEGWNTRYD